MEGNYGIVVLLILAVTIHALLHRRHPKSRLQRLGRKLEIDPSYLRPEVPIEELATAVQTGIQEDALAIWFDAHALARTVGPVDPYAAGAIDEYRIPLCEESVTSDTLESLMDELASRIQYVAMTEDAWADDYAKLEYSLLMLIDIAREYERTMRVLSAEPAPSSS